jgi:AraC-like DNA-binding protein
MTDNRSSSIISCAYSSVQKTFDKHFHNVHELIYVFSGRAKIQVAEKSYNVEPNTLIFISNLEEHSVQIIEEPYLRYFVELSSAQLDRLIDDPKLKSVFISRSSDFCHCFEVQEIEDKLKRLFQELVEEFNTPDSYSDNYVSAIFNQIMISCYRSKKDQFPVMKKNFGNAIFEARKFIDQNFDQEISVTELAEKLYVSPSYLSHAFKEWIGYSPKQYIMLSRISYAKELLINSNLSVAEIAFRCGFGDCNNFIRSFKSQCGATPNQYKKNNL